MKIWIDSTRRAPKGYICCRSVKDAIWGIKFREKHKLPISLLDLSYEAGPYAGFGGDYIEVLKWLQKTGRNYPIHIHAKDPADAEKMRAIIRHNDWEEVC